MINFDTTGDCCSTEYSSTQYTSPVIEGDEGGQQEDGSHQKDDESMVSSTSTDYHTMTGSTTSNDANEIAVWLSQLSLGRNRQAQAKQYQSASLLQTVSDDDSYCGKSNTEAESLSSDKIRQEVVFWISKLGLNMSTPSDDSELSDEEGSRSGSEDEHGKRRQLSNTKYIDLDHPVSGGKANLLLPDSPTAPSSTSETHDSHDQTTLDSCNEEYSSEEGGNGSLRECLPEADSEVVSAKQPAVPSRSPEDGDKDVAATQIRAIQDPGSATQLAGNKRGILPPGPLPVGNRKADHFLQTEQLLQSMRPVKRGLGKDDVQRTRKPVGEETEEDGLYDDGSSGSNKSGSTEEYDSSASGSEDDDSSYDSSYDSCEESSDGSSEVTASGNEDEIMGDVDSQNKEENGLSSPTETDGTVDAIYLEATDPGPMPGEEEKVEHDYSNVDMSQHFEFIQDPELKRLASKLHKRLNLDPWDGTSNLKDEYVQDFVQENPRTCQVQYFYNHFNERLFPLNMLCALNPSVQTVEATYNAFPPAADQCDPWIGSPLHYACAYRADMDVVQFLLMKKPNTTTKLNDLLRTPLHLACVFKASMPVIQLLIKANPSVLAMKDRNGCTPLHLAVENGAATGVVSALIRKDKSSCMSRSNSNMTPLHLACARSATRAVIKTLMDADPEAIQAVDDLGRTPLHVAAQYGAALPIVQMLVKACPDLTGEETNRGETALDLAKKHQGPPDVTSFLSEL